MRILLCLLLVACGDDDPASLERPGADIGPEGGVLDGGAQFPGFSLTIPAGALSETVRVEFAGALDPTPLPANAFRVGPQVVVEPAGTPLAAPAELTLAIDYELRHGFENPQDCKVWMRDGDGWRRIEPTATTDDSITVPIDVLGMTAAAGVVSTPQRTSCTGCVPIVTVQPEAPCTDPSGYCLSRIDSPTGDNAISQLALDAATVVDNKLYFLQVDSSGSLSIRPVSYDLATKTAVRYPLLAIEELSAATSIARMAVTENEDVYVAISSMGVVKFPKTGTISKTDIPAGEGAGVSRPESVMVSRDPHTGDDRVVRATSIFSFATKLRDYFLEEGTRSKQTLAPSLLGDSVVLRQWTFANGPSFTGFARSKREGMFTCVTYGTNNVETRPVLSCSRSATAPHNELASIGAFAQWDGMSASVVPARSGANAAKFTARLADGSRANLDITFAAGVRDLEIGDDRRLYAIDSTRSEISFVDPDNAGAVSTLPLTALPDTDPAYAEFQPQRIIALRGKNELLLITRGNASTGANRLLRIRRAQ